MDERFPNGEANGNGRTPGGRFRPGCKPGPGNPHAADVGKHRAAFFRAIKARDIVAALDTIRAVMADPEARAADRLAAASELLDRVIGKAAPADFIERIERLERALEKP